MRKINGYIFTSVASATLVVMLVIVSLNFISELIDQMRQVRADYTPMEGLIYSCLSIPSSIYNYLPLSCLIGCLAGLGLLANSSELTVIRASGVSVKRIIWSVMRPTLFFIALSTFLGEFVTPTSEQYKQSRRAIALGHQSALQGQRGVWNREGNELIESTYVESAIFQGDHWFEKNGERSKLENNAIQALTFESNKWESELSPKILDVLVLSADDLPIQRLYSYASYLEKQGQDASEYRLAFWKKVFQPLATLSLVMIAISFIFGPLRSVTMGYRIFVGVIVGILFRLTQDLLGPSSLIYGFSPLIAVLGPQLMCLLIGMGLLSRSR